MFKSLARKEKKLSERKQLAKLKVEHRKAVSQLSKKQAELRDYKNKVSELEEEAKHLRYLHSVKLKSEFSDKRFSLNGYISCAQSISEEDKSVITVDMGDKGLTKTNEFQFLVPMKDSDKLVGKIVKVTIEELPKNYNPAEK